ncbi:MAG: hypothetical protein ACOZCE_06895 [Spirochaetota bacterium]
MKNEFIKASVHNALEECKRHESRLLSAKGHLSAYIPLHIDVYLTIDDDLSSFIDQMVYRFSKLQDTLGEKIFPSILKLGEEEIKSKTFLDILNRIEELGIVKTQNWLLLREIRNEISHDYADDDLKIVETLNIIYEKSSDLIDIFHNVKLFMESRFGIK